MTKLRERELHVKTSRSVALHIGFFFLYGMLSLVENLSDGYQAEMYCFLALF